MGLFGKKKQPTLLIDKKCPANGCDFTCDDAFTMKRHTDYKHPEMAKQTEKK